MEAHQILGHWKDQQIRDFLLHMGMEKKEHLKKDRERIEAVLQILKKQAPLTVKQVLLHLSFYFFFLKKKEIYICFFEKNIWLFS